MIEAVIADWHSFTKGQLAGGLEKLLADDCVFHSPVVFSPQVGKFKVMIRPLQGINAVHARMGEILAAMKPAG